MFEWSEEEGRYMSAHHPFTLPQKDSEQELEGDLSKVRAVAYDIVLNGYELGAAVFGSIRKICRSGCLRHLASQLKKLPSSLASFGGYGLWFSTAWRPSSGLGPLCDALGW